MGILKIGDYLLGEQQNGVCSGAIADPFVTDRSYSKGDLVMNNGFLYSALADMGAGLWDENKWLKTNVAAKIPNTTADLVNDSAQGGAGFLSNVNEWEDIT